MTKTSPPSPVSPTPKSNDERGHGGETHQRSESPEATLTTNQGIPIADDQNSLKAGARGPTLLEDFVLRDKITHFDHERIPERIVHARGSGAHGYFEARAGLGALTKAAFLQTPGKRTPVYARFSTVAGGAGSADLVRDVRGFAVRLYTEEGNFDLVGNNIPVFFIQDAMKFPDLIHSVKMEPDRGFPQAGSAHDTFWDFISLMPESMHMILWAMSDRAIPRSLRMMEGFGIHTFRFIDAAGTSTFVKFHWRPSIGAQSVLWDEAVKINGADPDFHRRDLWQAIERGDFPKWDLAVQTFDQATADSFAFDILDPTKLIPEEVVPLQIIGTMVLDRNPDNFFAETEQIAFHPGNLVPGIDFSDDPLLQGRLFSYIDTQLSRLGGPNFHELPINRPKCPMRSFQRDGIHQMDVPRGRVAYEPNSLAPQGPRENVKTGFASHPSASSGDKTRARSESFSDHYSQARMFWRSMTKPEQAHIIAAFTFELGQVETDAVRNRVLGHLAIVATDLLDAVTAGLGPSAKPERLAPAKVPIDLPPSPALSLLGKAQPTLAGRSIGCLVEEGVDAALVAALRAAAKKAGATLAIVAPTRSGVLASDGARLAADHPLGGGPSLFFDAVVVATATPGPGVVDWVRDAFHHLKVIGYIPNALPVLKLAGASPGLGVVKLGHATDAASFVESAQGPRVWERKTH